MTVKDRIKKLKNDYVINQVKNLKIPTFKEDVIVRYRIVFGGRVQKIGFRLEMQELAKRLELTGFCCNLENGDVLSELQGAKNKINFLVDYMESLKRIRIKSKTVKELAVDNDEKVFLKR